MNIDPLSTSTFVSQPQIGSRESSSEEVQSSQEENDSLSAELSSKVRTSLEEMPEVRQDVVERGRQLLADPNYPSPQIIREIAGMITPFAEG